MEVWRHSGGMEAQLRHGGGTEARWRHGGTVEAWRHGGGTMDEEGQPSLLEHGLYGPT
jgi:hypothetical protein